MIEQDQDPGLLRSDLAAQLGADRSTGAGDEDSASEDVTGEQVVAWRHGVTSEQVGQLDVAQRRQGNLAAHQLANSGQDAGRDGQRLESVEDLLAAPRAHRRQGDDQHVDPLLACARLEVLE